MPKIELILSEQPISYYSIKEPFLDSASNYKSFIGGLDLKVAFRNKEDGDLTDTASYIESYGTFVIRNDADDEADGKVTKIESCGDDKWLCISEE